jgi:hypothetical protein
MIFSMFFLFEIKIIPKIATRKKDDMIISVAYRHHHGTHHSMG